ncbi:MAG: ATP-binding protein [Acidobacteria bacterium]|nr:ATP-binding protein [Acidobacteriota bacterium]
MRDRFTPERKVILVQGPSGSGKSVLLAQFVKSLPYQCFSFFVGTTVITSDPRYFLLDLCEQMGQVLGRRTEQLENLNTSQLKQLFNDYLRKVAQQARRDKIPYYFVIDGLEAIPVENQEQTIVELLPAEPLPNIYLLASSEPGRELPFSYFGWDVLFFSDRESIFYLEGLGLDIDDIKQVHNVCGGMPGYLSAIRRLLSDGVSFQDISSKLPKELQALFDIEFSRIQPIGDALLLTLSVLAYAKEKLSVQQLSSITSSNPEEIDRLITKASFLKLTSDDQTVVFVSDAYKHYVAQRLRRLQEQAEDLLITYYARDPYSKSSLLLLPTYLAEPRRYEQLKDLVSTDYLIGALDRSRDTSLLRQTLRVVGDQSFKKEDWQLLIKHVLVSSLLKNISEGQVAEAEIGALLELGDYEQAFEIAYQALLPADRLEILAQVCSRMQKEGLRIPENVLTELDQMAANIDASSLKERAVKIAASLFEVLPVSALSLVEKSVGEDAGENALDIARATLAINLRPISDEDIKSRITDQSIRDFASAHSSRAGKLTVEEVLLEVEKIKDTSGKVLLLRTWCNSNRGNTQAFQVVEKALEIITVDPSYAAPIRSLRQFAEPLKACSSSEAVRLIERLDLLKSSSITEPFEELTRLELVLAACEENYSSGLGIERFLKTYFSFDDVTDLDVRCACLVRVLISLPEIDKTQSLNVETEIEERLIKEFDELLGGAGEHFQITRNIIGTLTRVRPDLAVSFAAKLNAVDRRDQALQEILWAYSDRAIDDVDLSFIESTLGKISEDMKREYSLLRIIRRFSQGDTFTRLPKAKRFINEIGRMQSATNQCYAYAYAIKALATAGEANSARSYYEQLQKALTKVDILWFKVGLEFSLATIFAKSSPDLARHLFEQAIADRKISPLAEESFAEIYLNSVRLTLRAFSGVIPVDTEYKVYRDKLDRMIGIVPSVSLQCQLFSDLALRHYLARREDDFREILDNRVIPYLETCADQEDKIRIIVQTGASLFEYHSDWAFELIAKLAPFDQDRALDNILKYLMSQKLPDDPVEWSTIDKKIDLRTARRCCQVLKAMNRDATLVWAMEDFVAALVQKDPINPNKEICRSLVEKEALDIIQRLDEIASSKLPNPEYIQHNGFLIAAQAIITRLKMAAAKRVTPSPSWADIIQDARTIPNMADKVFVLSFIGEQSYRSDMKFGHACIQEAENLLPQITNVLDRANRTYFIARAWKSVNVKEAARMHLQTAMTLLRVNFWDKARDDLAGQILKTAHALDPDFAASLVTLIENPLAEHNARLNILVEDLERNPTKVKKDKTTSVEELQSSMGKAAWQLLGALNSGSGPIRHPKDAGQWLNSMIDASFYDTYPVIAWSIENTQRQTKQSTVHTNIFNNIIDSLQLCLAIGQFLTGIREQNFLIINDMSLPDNILFFRAGTRKDALLTLQGWLETEATGYLKIYDPYFSPSDLELLKHIHPDVQVYILTTWKAHKGISPGDRNIENLYRAAWNNISQSPAPWTQIKVVGTATNNDSPLHSRYIVTEGAGIIPSTSLSGLGLKDADVRILDAEESARIEASIIDPELGPQLRIFKGEKLLVHVFLL